MIVFAPAFLPSWNLMLDMPALALTLGALALFVRAATRQSIGWAVCAGLAAGLAAQTKYNGLIAFFLITCSIPVLYIRGGQNIDRKGSGSATSAAIAGTAVLLQERALRLRQRYRLTERLPSVADAERLELGLLLASEIVLGVGIMTGMATEYFIRGVVLTFDHKTVLTTVGFVVIGLLLIAHYLVGLRGRRAARIVLVGYLLVTLGYPGVKFVTDVLLR